MHERQHRAVAPRRIGRRQRTTATTVAGQARDRELVGPVEPSDEDLAVGLHRDRAPDTDPAEAHRRLASSSKGPVERSCRGQARHREVLAGSLLCSSHEEDRAV